MDSMITKQVLKNKYVFWDIDGTLAAYRFNGHVADPNGTDLLADVTNTNKSTVARKIVTIDILDKTGNKMTSSRAVIEDLAAGAKYQLNASVTADVANAYDYRVNG